MMSLKLLSAYVASAARGFAGSKVAEQLGPRPSEPLELYEFEACPYCRKVREMISWLDLEVVIYPCPKRGGRYRPIVVAEGGKAQFPYLVDPNTDTRMYESEAIIAYLAKHYGTGELPASLKLGPLTLVSASMSSWLRPAGTLRAASNDPQKTLRLYGFEGSPACRLVREELCSLELCYLLRSCAPGSSRAGTGILPRLFDPNTDSEHTGPQEILRHLARYRVS
ncbi:MAG: glutathione S-transferase N-terminal domain-containing protein [Nannocystaceae bacterium]